MAALVVGVVGLAVVAVRHAADVQSDGAGAKNTPIPTGRDARADSGRANSANASSSGADGGLAQPGAGASQQAGHDQVGPTVPGEPDAVRLTLPAAADLKLDRDPDLGTPRFARRRSAYLSRAQPGAQPEAVVAAFIESNGRMFTLHPTDIAPPNARLARDVTTRHNGMRSLTWQQQKDGLDIFGATFALNLTADNRIINVSSRALHLPCVRFHATVTVTEAEAARIAAAYRRRSNASHPNPEPRTLNSLWVKVTV